eukprot:1188172-Prorocentrum_minimum.AAC.2
MLIIECFEYCFAAADIRPRHRGHGGGKPVGIPRGGQRDADTWRTGWAPGGRDWRAGMEVGGSAGGEKYRRGDQLHRRYVASGY